MLIDLERSEAPTSLDCDVCVVGSGAVGLVIAANLADRGRSVVLLEGGGVGLEQRSQDLYRTVSVGHPFKGLSNTRFRVLGGTTTSWGGQVIPLDPIVFEDRPWISNMRWPIQRETLDPFFLKAYGALGLGNVELDDSKVWRFLKYCAPRLGDDLETVLTRFIPRANFARLFKRHIDQHQKLTVVVHANMTSFSLDEAGTIVKRIYAQTIAGKTITVRAGASVLACGAIENARLLLQPLHEEKRAPWSDNRWIGRGFLDHLDSTAGAVTILDRRRFHDLFDGIHLKGFRYLPKIRLSSAAQRRNQLVNISAQFLYDTSEHFDYIKMLYRSVLDGRMPSNILAAPRHVLPVARISLPFILRYLREHRSFKPSNASVSFGLFCEQIPNEDSVVRLSKKERDALGMFCTEIDWKINGNEIATFSAFARSVRDGLSRAGLAKIELDPALEHEDPAFLTKVHDSNHQMSTTRMASTAQDGVVDVDLRVHGMKNLYVAGASVFPTTGFANPTFTAIALALRLCEHLVESDAPIPSPPP